MTAPLATAAVSSRLSNEPGRALIAARGHHVLTDAPPMLGGSNESANPVELLLAALAACGTFVFERAAQERGIALHGVSVTASGDFDPRGVCGEAVDPRFQAIRVRVALDGPDAGQKELLLQAFRSRCPVYATLSRGVDLQLELA
jgi:putative redox protein